MQDRLRKGDWFVAPVPLAVARDMISRLHYSLGSSKQAVFVFGLFRCFDGKLAGVTQWIPPTREAAMSVSDGKDWRGVISLSRMVVEPWVPKNACSFLLARCVHQIRMDGRYHTLLTYADTAVGHGGGVYKASNWEYLGLTKGRDVRWLDGDGKQVSKKATVNRTYAQMEALGYIRSGKFPKHKYRLRLLK